jgi:hypothetical protein
VIAAGVVAITFASLGTRAAPVSAQATPALWGIDSCSSAQSVVPGTRSALGNPQFMARYLGTSNACGTPGLTSSEVSYLSSQGIYVMLIADPSSVVYSSGTADAQAAIQEAQSLGAPPGTAIFRDVENSSPISVSYIESWYTAFESSTTGYVPGFYENPYPNGVTQFPGDFCSAESTVPTLGTSVVLWSDELEPDYGNGTAPTAANAPAWNPYEPPCANTTVAWQYEINGGFPSGSWPNVDVDEFDTAYESLLWNGPKGPGAYTAVQPYRICDTRSASSVGYTTECTGDTLGPNQSMSFQVTGVDGPQDQSVPSDAQSVVLNVTDINGSAGTFLTVFPAGDAVPTASNLNVNVATNQANLAVVALGTAGQVSIYNSVGSINVAVDVEGYFAAPTVTSAVPGLYHPIPPLRVCDTRAGTGTDCSGTSSDNLLAAYQWTKVVVSGCPPDDLSCSASVPTNGTAAAVALNLTAVHGSAGTFLSVVPPNSSDACPTGSPAFSNLNVNAGDNLANREMAPLGPHQDVCVYNSQGSINFILDVNGWFGNGEESTQGASFYTISPLRLCDTRSAGSIGYTTECSGETLGSDDALTIPVAGIDGLPAAGGSSPPVAMIANVTAVDGTAGTFFTLYPASASAPVASDLNVAGGQNRANLVIVGLSASGNVDLYNDQGNINAVVDIAGWFQ